MKWIANLIYAVMIGIILTGVFFAINSDLLEKINKSDKSLLAGLLIRFFIFQTIVILIEYWLRAGG